MSRLAPGCAFTRECICHQSAVSTNTTSLRGMKIQIFFFNQWLQRLQYSRPRAASPWKAQNLQIPSTCFEVCIWRLLCVSTKLFPLQRPREPQPSFGPICVSQPLFNSAFAHCFCEVFTFYILMRKCDTNRTRFFPHYGNKVSSWLQMFFTDFSQTAKVKGEHGCVCVCFLPTGKEPAELLTRGCALYLEAFTGSLTAQSGSRCVASLSDFSPRDRSAVWHF